MKRVLPLLLLSSLAHAYELKRDSTGEVVRWAGAVEFVMDAGAAKLLGDEKSFSAVQAALETMAEVAPGLKLTVRAGETAGVGFDRAAGAKNQSEIVVPEEWVYDTNVIAVTVVTVNARDHRILDADIAFNTVHRRFRVLPEQGDMGGEYDDIQNTFTHELGHAVGLAHNAEEPLAVMYPGARRGEVQKRSLSDDDRAGLQQLYGTAESALTAGAEGTEAMGCSASAGSLSGWVALLLLPLALLRRRRSMAAAAALVVAAPSAALAFDAVRGDAPAADAAIVATVQVKSARTREATSTARLLTTELEVSVLNCLKGRCPATMRLVVPGGRLGDLEQYVEGAPVPQVGATLGVTVQPGAEPAAPSPRKVDVFRLAQLRDFAAFASGLSKAGLRTDLPLPQVSTTQR